MNLGFAALGVLGDTAQEIADALKAAAVESAEAGRDPTAFDPEYLDPNLTPSEYVQQQSWLEQQRLARLAQQRDRAAAAQRNRAALPLPAPKTKTASIEQGVIVAGGALLAVIGAVGILRRLQ